MHGWVVGIFPPSPQHTLLMHRPPAELSFAFRHGGQPDLGALLPSNAGAAGTRRRSGLCPANSSQRNAERFLTTGRSFTQALGARGRIPGEVMDLSPAPPPNAAAALGTALPVPVLRQSQGWYQGTARRSITCLQKRQTILLA